MTLDELEAQLATQNPNEKVCDPCRQQTAYRRPANNGRPIIVTDDDGLARYMMMMQDGCMIPAEDYEY